MGGSIDGWVGGSLHNIPPGQLPFPLDRWLACGQEVTRFEMKPVEIRSW